MASRRVATMTIVENIDIGGPAMIRAGAKNHGYVTVVTDPADYGAVLAALTESGGETALDASPRSWRPRLCPHRRL